MEDGVRPMARDVSVIAFSEIDVPPTPTPTNKEAFNGRRYNDKYVSVSTGFLSD